LTLVEIAMEFESGCSIGNVMNAEIGGATKTRQEFGLHVNMPRPPPSLLERLSNQ
jgi:hypothetical protein